MMGSPPSEKSRRNDETQHRVTLTKGFYIQTTEVTQGQWKAIMENNPSYFTGKDNLPVESVSWSEAKDFITQLNTKGQGTYRLPTEAEWEYAARAGTTTAYFFGDGAAVLDDYAWFSDNSGGKTHPVAQKRPNGWGLYDTSGNVSEWVQDISGSDPTGSVTDPLGENSGSNRVLRGGGWINDAPYCRSALRYDDDPSDRSPYLGFRPVKSLP